MSSRKVPKSVWYEAAKWETYILYRSCTLSVKKMTPEEACSGVKPLVYHFKVFGCVAYVHILVAHRKKLNVKSTKCIHLGVSGESKTYKLYDPTKKKIQISRDAIFEESKG